MVLKSDNPSPSSAASSAGSIFRAHLPPAPLPGIPARCEAPADSIFEESTRCLIAHRAVTRDNFGNIQAVMPGTGVSHQRSHLGQEPEAKAGIRYRFSCVIVEAQADAVAAAGYQLRLAVQG